MASSPTETTPSEEDNPLVGYSSPDTETSTSDTDPWVGKPARIIDRKKHVWHAAFLVHWYKFRDNYEVWLETRNVTMRMARKRNQQEPTLRSVLATHKRYESQSMGEMIRAMERIFDIDWNIRKMKLKGVYPKRLVRAMWYFYKFFEGFAGEDELSDALGGLDFVIENSEPTKELEDVLQEYIDYFGN